MRITADPTQVRMSTQDGLPIGPMFSRSLRPECVRWAVALLAVVRAAVTNIVSKLAQFLVDVTRRAAKQFVRPLSRVKVPAQEHEPLRDLRPVRWHQCPAVEVDVLNQLQVLLVTYTEIQTMGILTCCTPPPPPG